MKRLHIRSNQRRSRSYPTIPLWAALVFPFVVEVALVVSALGYSVYRNDQQLTRTLAERLTTETTNHINHDLESYLAIPVHAAQISAATFQLGILDWKETSTVERYFVRQLSSLDGTANAIEGVGLIDEQNNLLKVGNLEDGSKFVRFRNPSTHFQTNSYGINSNQARLQPLDGMDFDPQNNPPGDSWYQTTKQSGKGGWRLVVIQPKRNESALAATYFEPFYDRTQTFQGVTTASIRLSQISKHLERLELGSAGRSFIIDRQGALIATSSGELPLLPNVEGSDADLPSPTTPQQGVKPDQRRLKATRSLDSMTKQAAQLLSSNPGGLEKISEPQLLDYIVNDRHYFVRIAPFNNDYGLDWLTVVVIQETNFAAEIQQNSRVIQMTCLVAIAGAIALGLFTAQWISKPMRRLSKASQDLMLGNLNEPVAETSRIRELEILAHSFNQMTDHLMESFDQVKTDLQISEAKFTKIFRNSPDPISLVSFPEGKFLEVNDSFLDLIEYSEADILTHTDTELKIWQSNDERQYFLRSLQDTNRVRGHEFRFRARSGKTLICLVSSEIIVLDGQHCVLSIGKDITERKFLEVALQQSEAKLSDILSSSNAGICSFRVYPDNHFEYDYISPGYYVLFGVQLEMLKSDPYLWQSQVHPDDRDKILSSVTQVLQPFIITEYRFYHPGGTLRWISDHLTIRRDDQTDCWVVTSVSTDITPRKRLAVALQQSEATLSKILNGATAGIAFFRIYADDRMEHDYISPGYQKLFGFSLEDLTANQYAWRTSVHPDDLDKVFTSVAQITAPSVTNEYRYFHAKDGTFRWFADSLTFQRDERSDCWIVTAVAVDITAQKFIEEKLRQSEANLRQAQQVAHIGSWDYDLATEQITGSDEMFRIHGLTPPPVSFGFQEIRRVIHPEDYEEYMTQSGAAIAAGISYKLDTRILRPDGSIRHVEVRGQPLVDDQGRLVRVVGTVLDITARKQAEESLRVSEERFRSAFNNSRIGMNISALDGRFLQVNEMLCQMYGYTAAELFTLRFQDITYPDDLQENLECLNLALAGEIDHYSLEKRFLHKNGQTIWTALSVSLIRGAQRQPLYFVAQVQDITARRQAEEHLRQEQDFSRSLVQALPTFFVAIDAYGRTLTMNDTMLEALGYTTDEVIGTRYLTTCIPAAEQEALRAVFHQVVHLRQALWNENGVLTKEGRVLRVKWRSVPVIGADGLVQFFFGVGMETGDRRSDDSRDRPSSLSH